MSLIHVPFGLWKSVVSTVLGIMLSGVGWASSVLQQKDNNLMKRESDCWIEIYMNEEFDKNGPRLLLVGAHDLTSLKGLNDRNWDNDIESIIVGPTASVSLYEEREFNGRVLIVESGQHIPQMRDFDLNNKIESLRTTCK